MNVSLAISVGLSIVLSACTPAAPPVSVDSLLAHPARLDALIEACRLHLVEASGSACATAAQAQRQRFMGDAHARYTPHPIDIDPASSRKK